MTVFYTSDLHIHHRLVAKLRYQKVFPELTVEQGIPEDVMDWHDEYLARQWDAVVTKDDVVWNLGDLVVSGTKTSVDRALAWIEARNGREHFIPGNHDPCHPLHRDSHKWQKRYLEVFESVQLAARRKFAMPDGTAREILLSHLPYAGDRDGEDREVQWRLRDLGRWLLHGHLHGTTPYHRVRTKQLDVGLDPWNLTPVAEQTLINLIHVLENPHQTEVPFSLIPASAR